MAIANVTLNNTYDEWRTATNQLITFVNEVESQQLINAVSNSAVLSVSARNIKRNDTLYLTLNVSSSVLDTSTLNVATANAVNIVFATLANTDARLILVSDDANVINSAANAAFIQSNVSRSHANAAFASANAGQASANAGQLQANTARVHANVAFEQANTARSHANAAFAVGNTAFEQANTARSHANAAFLAANTGLGLGAAFTQANTARVHANVAFEQANTARVHANASFDKANAAYVLADTLSGNQAPILEANKAAFDNANAAYGQANTARVHANTAHATANAGLTQANTARVHANAAFLTANSALPNTSGASFAGNLQMPSGNLTIGSGTTQGIRLFIQDHTPTANVFPQVKAVCGTQLIQLNANTSGGAWNDLMMSRDISIIYSRGQADDAANLVIGPWTDSSFGYKQDGEGRHGFNTSNPRFTIDANGSANISGSLIVGAINTVPTIQSSFAQANTSRDHANAAFLAANTGLGVASAFAQANTSRDHANAAFGKANSGATIINTDAISATRYIVFTDKTSGILANANVATALSYNPSSGAFVATSLKSSALYDSSNRQLLIKDSTGTVVWGN